MPSSKKTARSPMPPIPLLIAMGGGVLLIITAILFARGNQPAVTPTIASEIQADIPYPEIERLSVKNAKTAFDAGQAVFLDVRGDDVYAMSHISGAISISLSDLASRLSELDKQQWIITYCT